ncbi:MAG TPA: hypothetical protein VNW49_09410 [Puia sp.]|nr:hypothetical protein [Puia sp.]
MALFLYAVYSIIFGDCLYGKNEITGLKTGIYFLNSPFHFMDSYGSVFFSNREKK